MNYLKITQYAYLIAGCIFAVDAFIRFRDQDQNAPVSAIFAGIGIFMFFFRRRFAKRFEAQKKSKSE